MEAENNESHITKSLHTVPGSSTTPQVTAAQTPSLSNELTLVLSPFKTENKRTREPGGGIRVLCEVKEVALA